MSKQIDKEKFKKVIYVIDNTKKSIRTFLMCAELEKKSDIPVFKQIINLIFSHILNHCIKRYNSDKHCSRYFTYDQLTSMLFGQV